VTVVQAKTVSRRKRNSSFWRELPILLGAAIVVAILVRTFVMQTYYVPSGSMEHTLNINDRVLVNKLADDFRDPERGEIIVFHSPVNWRQEADETVFVKRVIGIPGDHIVCCSADGKLMINGVAITEPYLNHDQPEPMAAQWNFNITVPPGRLWLMGDNRYDSDDSAYNYHTTNNIMDSTVPIKSVIGRAFVLFWPVGRARWLTIPSTFDHVPAPGGS